MVAGTYSICGYFSVSFTLMSVSLMFRYWSTECSVPQMLKISSQTVVNKIIPINWIASSLPEIIFELNNHLFADQRFEE